MPADSPTIIATSMGFGSRRPAPFQWAAGPVFDLAFELAGNPERPRLCYVGTAGGDNDSATLGVYGAFVGTDVRVTHLSLFPMPNVDDVRAHLLNQDMIWVGGGSVANLLALWRLHGVDAAMREAWEAGVVLAGVSAGSICWHIGGTTDSFGLALRPVTNGLAFLPYSNGVHYNSESQRRPLLQHLIQAGDLPPGYATDDGVGLVYRGTELVEVVADRLDVAAYRIEPGNGAAVETVLPARLLSAASQPV